MALLEVLEPMDDDSRFNAAFDQIAQNYPEEDMEKIRQISREAAIARGRPAVANYGYDHPENFLD